MAPKHFLDIDRLPGTTLRAMLDNARHIKSAPNSHNSSFKGKFLVMIFEKPSTRTRVSFDIAMRQLGGETLTLNSADMQLGRGETIADTAKVLSGYGDAILLRTTAHENLLELAANASIPVINGLTDLLHPCQVMADVLTMIEEFGEDLSSLRVAWIGDGNNMANSWLNAAHRLGFSLRLACPEGYDPDPAILARAQGSGDVAIVRDPGEAVGGAHVVTTDVWASMGQEEEQSEREAAFRGFCVNGELMARADPSAIFLHCLPAHRGEEVTADVIDGAQSRIFEEAENRLHVQKAIILDLMA